MIERHVVCRDDGHYLAFPDLAMTGSGRLVCVFLECRHHHDRRDARVVLCHSDDAGRTWSPRRPLPAPVGMDGDPACAWNCPRINVWDGGRRLVAVCDRTSPVDRAATVTWLWHSTDEGVTWEGPRVTPLQGIVPDKPLQIRRADGTSRVVAAAHSSVPIGATPAWTVRAWISDNGGVSWDAPVTVAHVDGLKLCEPSVFELPGGDLACLLRENSAMGLDAYKTVSRDGGRTWGEVVRFPLPGCHRPVAGLLRSGRVLVAYRFTQGGAGGGVGGTFHNLFVALTDPASCLASDRAAARTRIMPLDYDRSARCDTGYSGWVQLPDETVYLVSYMVDDAPRAHLRGYRFHETDLLLP